MKLPSFYIMFMRLTHVVCSLVYFLWLYSILLYKCTIMCISVPFLREITLIWIRMDRLYLSCFFKAHSILRFAPVSRWGLSDVPVESLSCLARLLHLGRSSTPTSTSLAPCMILLITVLSSLLSLQLSVDFLASLSA